MGEVCAKSSDRVSLPGHDADVKATQQRDGASENTTRHRSCFTEHRSCMPWNGELDPFSNCKENPSDNMAEHQQLRVKQRQNWGGRRNGNPEMAEPREMNCFGQIKNRVEYN